MNCSVIVQESHIVDKSPNFVLLMVSFSILAVKAEWNMKKESRNKLKK